jgi:hypothetical protein
MNMKRFLLGLSLMFFALSCVAGQEGGSKTDTNIMEAKSAIKQVAGGLQTELKASIQAGGPVAAIGVCNTQAMPITRQASVAHDMQVSRVSLNNRNPENGANDWQAAVLESFESQKSNGADITKLAWSETVDVDGGQEFRFMKAIPTGAVCLICHGTQMSPEVSEAIANLYPQDKATGYSEGDIRGAFVVTRSLQ